VLSSLGVALLLTSRLSHALSIVEATQGRRYVKLAVLEPIKPQIDKVSRSAVERSELLRSQYQLIVGEKFTPEMLVFLDEAACNRHTTNRTYAWALSSQRARRRDFFVRGQR
jgi:hypothetical protein